MLGAWCLVPGAGGALGAGGVLSAGVSVKVATIQGLKYMLKRTDSLRRAEDVAPELALSVRHSVPEVRFCGDSPRSPGESVIAMDVTVMLTDEEPPTDKAFYWVEVSAP